MTIDPLDFPAVEGNVVTQAHTDYCAEHGHGFYMIDGVLTAMCPRCGCSRGGERGHTFDDMPACGRDTDGQGRLCNDSPGHAGDCTH